jgi:hypothetical protein
MWCLVQKQVQYMVLCKRGTNIWCYMLFSPAGSHKQAEVLSELVIEGSLHYTNSIFCADAY